MGTHLFGSPCTKYSRIFSIIFKQAAKNVEDLLNWILELVQTITQD